MSSVDTTTVPPYVLEQQGTFAAPFTYTIPGSLEVRPETASAFFDGSGASGQFLACLTFYSPEGSLLARVFNPNPVQAGDSALVSYVPPFGSAASSSTGGGITAVDSPDGSITVTNPTGPTVDLSTFTAYEQLVSARTSIADNGDRVFTGADWTKIAGDTLLDTSTMLLNETACYIVTVNCQMGSPTRLVPPRRFNATST